MSEYFVERFVPAYGDDALAVMDGGGNVVSLFSWDQRQEAEALAEALNAAWRAGHARGVGSTARPSLAPEHVAILRDMLNFCQEYTRDHPIPRAIRAALAALGEDPL